MKGYFGQFGGRFGPELLVPPLEERERAIELFLPQERF